MIEGGFLETWKPIATIPYDGRRVLVYMPNYDKKIEIASYHPNIKIIGHLFSFDYDSEPTHWMPLPNPPEGQ